MAFHMEINVTRYTRLSTQPLYASAWKEVWKYGDLLQRSFAKVLFLFFLELAFDLNDIFIPQHLSGSFVLGLLFSITVVYKSNIDEYHKSS